MVKTFSILKQKTKRSKKKKICFKNQKTQTSFYATKTCIFILTHSHRPPVSHIKSSLLFMRSTVMWVFTRQGRCKKRHSIYGVVLCNMQGQKEYSSMQYHTVKILHYKFKSHSQTRFIIIRNMYLKYEKYKQSVCSNMVSVSVLL